MLCIVFTLTFDSSPIKGEGDWWVCLVVPHPVGMTGANATLHGRNLHEWLYFVGVGGYELHHFGEVVVSHVSLVNADDVVFAV